MIAMNSGKPPDVDNLLPQLSQGAENFTHYHTPEALSQSDGAELQAAATQNTITATTYTATARDDYILCDTTSNNITVTLPAAAQGREFEVVKTATANRLDVIPTGTDTILWSTGVSIYNRGTAIRFKATTGNWIAI